MRALVIYESMFGNTKTVAEAIADGIAQHLEVTTVDVGAAPTALPDDVGLLVAGGPTHAFEMSRPNTRQAAAQQAGSAATPVSTGLREWLSQLSGPSSAAVVAATFDTRVKRRGIPGSAARKPSSDFVDSDFRPLAQPRPSGSRTRLVPSSVANEHALGNGDASWRCAFLEQDRRVWIRNPCKDEPTSSIVGARL